MNERVLPPVNGVMRLSLWLMAAAMLLIIGLKSIAPAVASIPWHYMGWPLLAASIGLARWRLPHDPWWRTLALFAYLITVLFFTQIDGKTSDTHVIELALMLGVGVLLVPALLAKYWLGEALDYKWFNGRWTWQMWLWLPVGFVIAFGFMWLYFNHLTPTLHHSWPLPLTGDRTDAMWRLFWGCNFIGV